MARWVTSDGSDYLKELADLLLPLESQYVLERAALEFPKWTVDLYGTASLVSDTEEGKAFLDKHPYTPSGNALSLRKQVLNETSLSELTIQHVFINRLPKNILLAKRNDKLSAFPKEGVAIDNYLGKYTLYQEVWSN